MSDPTRQALIDALTVTAPLVQCLDVILKQQRVEAVRSLEDL